jgi:HPt (histidine-containing phosphotransfer) domain-containing protein
MVPILNASPRTGDAGEARHSTRTRMTDAPSADASTPLLPALDITALARLERFGGKKLLREMIQLFQSAAPERIAAARAGVAAGDIAAAELALHSLKSSSAQLGAMRLGRLSEEGEVLTRAGTLDGVDELVSQLEDELVRVQEWLAGILEREAQ